MESGDAHEIAQEIVPRRIPEEAGGNPLYADIVLPLPVDQPFTYAIPASLRARAVVGMRAIAPVQRRVETGFVVALNSQTSLDKVRPLIDLPDDGPVFSSDMIELCRWIADYYCCSWGEALANALPPGMKGGSKFVYHLVPEAMESGRFTDRQRKVIAELYKRGPMTEGQIAKSAGATALSNTLQSLVRRGLVRAEASLGSGGVSMLTETYVRLVETAIPENEALAALQRRAPKQAAVYLDLLHNEPRRAATALYEKHGVSSSILAALESKGLVERFEQECYRRPDLQADARAAQKHQLNADQQRSCDAIVEAIAHRRFQTFLLKGITGSGKTEVYLQAIEQAIALGRQAIMLVPEISLTPQTVGRLLGRFGEDLAVLHSGLSAGERYDEWRRVHRGEVRIVVGARSAIFAPLPDAGLIIVDEEHDTSYKQGETPRYHARDVAIMRAHMAKAACVLGSATPSLESYFNSENGKSVRLSLDRRATNSALPEVQVVDMRIENKERTGEVILSLTLEDAVNERLAAREQVILLLNRRGFAPFVMCPMCGWVAECDNCQVSLTYHSRGSLLRCHYCDAQRPQPVICDKCHFNPLIYLGTGTQKVEEYLERAFPGARIERMDRDTVSGKGGHAKILGRFSRGEIDILVGTQMLAKGHDYPGVTLVGVINADTGLSHPDFRAPEFTFQLLTQVAGRAGRGDRPGRVIVQTFRPKHYAIQTAIQHDYAGFYAAEIEHRHAAGYPPFRRMANLLVDAEDPEVAERAALQLRRIVRDERDRMDFRGVEIMGPAPAVVSRVKNRYRWHLAMLSRSGQRLNQLARCARDSFLQETPGNKALLKVDLDPYGFQRCGLERNWRALKRYTTLLLRIRIPDPGGSPWPRSTAIHPKKHSPENPAGSRFRCRENSALDAHLSPESPRATGCVSSISSAKATIISAQRVGSAWGLKVPPPTPTAAVPRQFSTRPWASAPGSAGIRLWRPRSRSDTADSFPCSVLSTSRRKSIVFPG
ncbi:MAG: primosomal protein N' [Candidatus Hydrogenedentes bacterium]|nr:primosomal protein N' [Candidatus Hydrogenedentota bacterium]